MQERVITIKTINWVDNSNQFPPQTHIYETPYLLSDFYLAFMFFRFYFLALALIMFSPVNERLYDKRVYKKAGFDPNFSF